MKKIILGFVFLSLVCVASATDDKKGNVENKAVMPLLDPQCHTHTSQVVDDEGTVIYAVTCRKCVTPANSSSEATTQAQEDAAISAQTCATKGVKRWLREQAAGL
jgi:microcystin-dependent protein